LHSAVCFGSPSLAICVGGCVLPSQLQYFPDQTITAVVEL
jgi:hypothetical protein